MYRSPRSVLLDEIFPTSHAHCARTLRRTMYDSGRYQDRTEAGSCLAEALLDRNVAADIVLAIPRGGLPPGRVVADALEVPLDIVVARKIGAPGNPEYAIGAVASDGSVWRNDIAIRNTGVSDADFEQRSREAAAEAAKKAEKYRRGRSPPSLSGKIVVLVDDGVATGSTVRACLKQVQAADPAHVVLAVPVGPPQTIAELEHLADEVVCPLTPSSFRGVGQFYERFDQVPDEAAMAYLE